MQKRCYFQTKVNIGVASYNIYCEAQRQVSNHWLIVKEHLISLFADGCVFTMQWEALYMTATTELFSLDVSSNFGALCNENRKGKCRGFLVTVMVE